MGKIMSSNLNSLVELREENIEGFFDWVWPKDAGRSGDGGAWVGPMQDWKTSHALKYFEFVNSFGTAIQAGGNCGMYPRLFSKYFNEVYTFEPDALNFFCLSHNCRDAKVNKFQAGLGSSHRSVILIKGPSHNVGMHTILDKPGATPLLMIDDFKYENLGLIQLDVEGFELDALKGAINTIEKHSPAIICERPSSDCKNLLSDLGYTERSTSIMDVIFSK